MVFIDKLKRLLSPSPPSRATYDEPQEVKIRCTFDEALEMARGWLDLIARDGGMLMISGGHATFTYWGEPSRQELYHFELIEADPPDPQRPVASSD